MGALTISNPKLSFLISDLRIHFPENAHEFLAHVGATLALSTVGGNNGTIVVTTRDGTATISYVGGVQSINDPNGILSATGGGFDATTLTDQFNSNPSVTLNTSLVVFVTGDCTVTTFATATADTSGRPGGDFLRTAVAPNGFEVAANGTIITPGDGLIHLSAGPGGFLTRANFLVGASASRSGVTCSISPNWS